MINKENGNNMNNQQKSGEQEVEDIMRQSTKLAEAGEYEAAKKLLKPSVAAISYGDVVYWGTLVSALIALVGQILNFITRSFYISPSYTLTAIWQNKTVAEIWEGAVGGLPQGHWYLDHITTGDGLTAFGISVGVFIVIPALIISGLMLFREKKFFFGILAMIAAAITIASMLGLIPLPIG